MWEQLPVSHHQYRAAAFPWRYSGFGTVLGITALLIKAWLMVSDCRSVVLPVGNEHAVFYRLPLLGPGRKAACGDRLLHPEPGQNPVGKTRFLTKLSHRPVILLGSAFNGPLGAPVPGEVFPGVFLLDAFLVRDEKHRRSLNPLRPHVVAKDQRFLNS